jgi:hypothetical protein
MSRKRAAKLPNHKTSVDLAAVLKSRYPNITPKELVLLGLERLPEPPYKGFHCVWSGFNDAFRVVFPELDPKEELLRLRDEGVIVVKPCKGGAIIEPVDNKKVAKEINNKAMQALSKMGLLE